MKHVLIIGAGLSGLSCAVELAENGISSTLVAPYPSERAQSVMAAGGINAALGDDDSPEQHALDTIKSGGNIAGENRLKDFAPRLRVLFGGLKSLALFSTEMRMVMFLFALLADKASIAQPMQVLPRASRL